MANTRIVYMYRSAGNMKLSHSVVVPGHDPDAIATIRAALEDGYLFIPSQVGMHGLQNDQGWELTEDEDHVWHELLELEATNDTPDEGADLEYYAEAFAAASGKWDVATATDELFGT